MIIENIRPEHVLFLGLAFISYRLFTYIRHPLRAIPGPFWARITRVWYALQVYNGKWHITNKELHDRLGPVIQIRPDEYSFDDPEAAKIIYGHGSKFDKAEWYFAFIPPFLEHIDLFTQRDPHRHSVLRRHISSYYSMSSMVTYEPYVDNCTAIFSERMSEFARNGKTIDLCRWLQFYAFDVITEITVSKRLGFLEKGEDIGGVISQIGALLSYASCAGPFVKFHRLFMKLVGNASNYLVTFTQELIDGYNAAPRPDAPDFLTKFMVRSKKIPEEFPESIVFINVASNIGAGSDTTGITLSAVFFYLLKNPSILELVRKEVNETLPNRNGRNITFAQSQNMPYLQAVLKETLRMHPAVGFTLSRKVPAEGANICGHFFPHGTKVGINAWVAHRNKSVFGEDADVFRPERWIDSSPEELREMERYFMPFGLGSRTCIGKNISLLEICKFVPFILDKFDFELQVEDLDYCDHWFVKQSNFKVAVRERA